MKNHFIRFDLSLIMASVKHRETDYGTLSLAIRVNLLLERSLANPGVVPDGNRIL